MTQLDARLSTGFPGHPKTKKLVRRLGHGAGFSLVCLILWARANRADGDLSGMSVEDIELAADWVGENDAFVAALVSVGYLDGEDGGYRLHDWAEHQPWAAGAEARSEKSRWAGLCKQHGRAEAARMMPEYASRLLEASQPVATGKPQAPETVPLAETGSAPLPLPLPSPSPTTGKPETERKDSSRRGTRLPDGWEPEEKDLAWARHEFPQVDLRLATDEFRDYWRGVTGQKGCKLDWPATWRNRVREVAQRRARFAPPEQPSRRSGMREL